MRTSLALWVLLVAGCSAPRSLAHPASRSVVRPARHAAREGHPVWLGAEVRGYPAGVIPGAYGEIPLSEHGVLTLDVAANLTDRRDWGEHDDEHGAGFGGGVGYRYFLGEALDGWFAGARLDLWSLSIDWRDDAPSRSGTSDVVVLQPTAEGGYAFRLGERWRAALFLAVGAEINAHTDGEDVGDGAIGILGVSLLRVL